MTHYEDEPNFILRVRSTKIAMPYQFIAIDKSKNKFIQKKKFNKVDGLSGKIYCTLRVLNGVIVGNEHEKINKINIIKPLKVDDILISPYTLKGCIRSFIASLNNEPIRLTENEAFFYRPNQYFANNHHLGLAAGFVKKINPDNSIEVTKIEPPFCFTKKTGTINPYIVLNNFEKYNMEIKPIKIICKRLDPTHGREMKFVSYRDGLDGKGNFNQLFGGHSSHNVFGYLRSKITANTLTASADIVAQYNAMPELIIKYHMQNHPNLKDENLSHNHLTTENIKSNIKENWEISVNDLLLYEYDTQTNEILSMGKHFRYLWSYKNRIWDFNEVCMIDVENFKKDYLFVTDEMFGYSYSQDQKNYMKEKQDFDIEETDKDKHKMYCNSKSGKIHFNFAKHITESGIIKKDFSIPGTDAPHASSYEFYLKQPDGTKLCNYGDRLSSSKSSLQGRKIYRRSSQYQNNIHTQVQNSHFNQIISELLISAKDKIALFKFTVNYENLSEYELALLLFSLNFGENTPITKPEDHLNKYCHQIGYGKNFGLGAVSILIDSISSIIYENEEFTEEIKNLSDFQAFFMQFTEQLNKSVSSKYLRFTNDQFQYPLDFSYDSHGNHKQTNDRIDIHSIFCWHSKVKEQDHKQRKRDF